MPDLPVTCTLSRVALKARRERLLNNLVGRAEQRLEVAGGCRLASSADRAEVELRPEARSSRRPTGDSTARRADGGGESDVGVHADPGRAEKRRPPRGPLDHSTKFLKAAGLPPVPQRPTSWQTFLKAHCGATAGGDFFTTEVWTWQGLVTYYTVFVLDLASRRVQILGSTPHPERAVHAAGRAPGDGGG